MHKMKLLILGLMACSIPALAQEPLTLLKKISPAWIPEEAASTATSTPRPGDPSAGRGASPLAEVTQHTALWGVPGGEKRAVFQRNLGVYDETLEEYHVSEPELWTTAAGHVMLDGQVRISLETVNGASALELSKTVNGVPQGYSLTLPLMELVIEEPGFSYRAVSSNLRLRIYGTGFDLYTNPIQQQRSAAPPYVFPYTETNITLTEQPDGSLAALPLWQLTRARMIGADKEIYPCEPWVVGAGELSFTCDDVQLPAAAFPYVVDPTGVYEPGAAGDDGQVWGIEPNANPWPPSGSGADAGNPNPPNERSNRTDNNWANTIGIALYDTRLLLTTDVVNSATWNIFISSAIDNADDFELAAEYWLLADMPIDVSDYVTSISGNAHAGTVLSALSGGGAWNALPMINLNLLVPESYTGLRFGMNSAGAPTGVNYFEWGAYESANVSYLEVIFNEATPGPTFRIISTDDDD